ncbi:MAG: hypothetical protein HY744_06480 [Deltaproteobacteria bacterium]|nr:hypothetical protein [Deltaproteobacteria bacterium]
MNTQLDPANCGACNNACGVGAVCSQAKCGLECLGGTSKCGDECVDTKLDPQHCGLCDKACAEGELCSGGQCGIECTGGTTKCGDGCADTGLDPANCGGCGKACGPGEVCSQGACGLACLGGTIKCGNECVDPQLDPANCGGCAVACGPGQVCAAGQCGLQCTGGTTKCGDACADTENDPANCGGCGQACGPGEMCAAEKCVSVCGGGTSKCGNKCVDLQTDAANCGGCANVCPQGQVCASGQCGLQCAGGTTKCGSKCADVQTDPANCGSCANACAQGLVCSAGQCGLVCTGGTTKCGSKCADLQSDAANCGSCGAACAGEQACLKGSCVGLVCKPNAVELCFGADAKYIGVGACKAGTKTCNGQGTGYGSCAGEVVPKAEDCNNGLDDDCDGLINEGCYASCLDVKAANPNAGDGKYFVDPDGGGGDPPFEAWCDMNIDGGGWTRFNWLKQPYVGGDDPFGQKLVDCKVDGLACRGRIPAQAKPAGLLVKDLTDKAYAAWKFNGSTISNAVLGALRDKIEFCKNEQGAWQPYLNTSQEAYCGTGVEGGCDSFYYTLGSCLGLGKPGTNLDGDHGWGASAFKMGASNFPMSDDYAFLNNQGCRDELGELYYR